jgi:hypothetical protein
MRKGVADLFFLACWLADSFLPYHDAGSCELSLTARVD